ncbi:Uncharacterised protein [Escherichia coli]|uniref:Uncharacterized protein n=2 Tax=Escherichia coli TaxID=562 RepID=A0A376M014_ECOLX|nr:Uncharacterised protein [Escherichia coli]
MIWQPEFTDKTLSRKPGGGFTPHILWEGFPEPDRAGGMTGDKVCKYGLIRVIIGSGDGFQNLFHHSGVDFLVLQVV